MTITFYNEAELPVECITTFGISVKETDSPIGYFGTGLKYAIAVLLREGCSIEIKTGEEIFNFFLDPDKVRGKGFEFIRMQGLNGSQRLPFTTELGKNWELWQAYRELWSNCQDENGQVFGPGGGYSFPSSGTALVVDGLDAIHEERQKFLLVSQPLFKLGQVEVHESESPAIFYKGIKVAELNSKYSYNILSHLDLTEDRTVSQSDVEWEIVRAMTTTTNMDGVYTLLTVENERDQEENYLETRLNFSKYMAPTDGFMKLIAGMKKKPAVVQEYYNHHYPSFIGTLPKETLSKSVTQKLQKLRDSLPYEPGNLYITALEGEDFRLVKDGITLNAKLLKEPAKLKFAYAMACLRKQHGTSDSYALMRDHLLDLIVWPAKIDKVATEKAA